MRRTPHTFTLTVRAEPAGRDHLGRDPAYRLKLFLKRALRGYGLRCLSIRPAELIETDAPPDGGDRRSD